MDFAHPEGKSDRDVVDWGKVIKVTDEHGDLGGRDETLHLIYVQGQRRTYKVRDDLGAVGIVPAKPGDLLALCTEDQIDIHQLASGPLDAVRTIVTLSAPPRTSELAKWSPRYIRDIDLVIDATSPKPHLDPDRHYLVYAHVQSADGPLWKMDRYWLEVPPAIRGASLVAANKRLWLVVEHPRHSEDTSGKRFVVTATAVLDELFP